MEQREFDFGEKRLIKETVVKYYEETDSKGKRIIHKEKIETKWFEEGGKLISYLLLSFSCSLRLWEYSVSYQKRI